MICHNELRTVREFASLLSRDPVAVFLRAKVAGRELQASLPSMLEQDGDLIVYGPERTWRAHVRRERGRGRIVMIPLRLPKRVLTATAADCSLLGGRVEAQLSRSHTKARRNIL